MAGRAFMKSCSLSRYPPLISGSWFRCLFPLSLLLGLNCVRAGDDLFNERIRPVLVEFCFDCHDDDTQKGGVNLARFKTDRSLHQEVRLWENALRQVEEKVMPPRNKAQPDADQFHQLVDLLGQVLANPDPEWLPRDPGLKVVHRLSRTEYNNSVQDLFGIAIRPADKFPPDGGGGGGFDNNADTLFVPPILMERYLAAAEEILEVAPRRNLILEEPVWYTPESWTARRNIERFLRKALRRPASPEDVARFLALFRKARSDGASFEDSFKVVCKAVLVSPRFLFRVEMDRSGDGPQRLDDFELASRLSYFLWSTMPDEALLDSAASGRLATPGEWDRQVTRMLDHPKARALGENFTGQWLGTRNLAQKANPNLNRFPQYTVELRKAMVSEPVEMFSGLIRENASLLQLLDADHTYVNGLLAEFYGLSPVPGEAFQKVSLPDRRRGGVVGMAAVLTQTSYPLRTSPVLRGKWILEEILGTPPPPPPPLVATLPPDDRVRDGQTLRQRLEEHRKKENCAACHSRLDPMGFALENFDAIGRWRDEIDGKRVDASGELPGGQVVDGPEALKGALMDRRQLFLRHITEKMLSYALGRGLEHYDMPVVKEIAGRVEEDGYPVRTLILEVSRSLPFQYRRPASQ